MGGGGGTSTSCSLVVIVNVMFGELSPAVRHVCLDVIQGMGGREEKSHACAKKRKVRGRERTTGGGGGGGFPFFLGVKIPPVSRRKKG